MQEIHGKDGIVLETKSKQKVILIDIDDTIEDLLPAWCAALNKKYNTSVSPSDITEWDMQKFFPTLSWEQIYSPFHNEDFWKAVKPKKDAPVYIRQLIARGYKIYLCTSTDYRNIKPKFEHVIAPYFPYIKWEDIIVAYNKQMIKTDYMIDDGVHNLEGGDFRKILMTAPHNKNYDAEANGMYRAENWSEIYEIIKSDEKFEGIVEI